MAAENWIQCNQENGKTADEPDGGGEEGHFQLLHDQHLFHALHAPGFEPGKVDSGCKCRTVE